ncbi:MAG: rRNA maturation RNase YbeY [Actinomycetota bacterium]
MTERSEPGGWAPARVAVADEQDRLVDVAALSRFGERALDAAGVPATHALSIGLIGREAIADLKGRYYGERRVTDVLAFAMDPLDAPGPATLGDIVICVAVAEQNARGLGVPVQAELEHLIVHGILHLTGRDHADPDGELAMVREERRILSTVRVGASS